MHLSLLAMSAEMFTWTLTVALLIGGGLVGALIALLTVGLRRKVRDTTRPIPMRVPPARGAHPPIAPTGPAGSRPAGRRNHVRFDHDERTGAGHG